MLETALAVAKQNLNATDKADEEDKQKIITDIVDPTPGAVVKDYFDDDDDQKDQFNNTTNRPIELNNYDKKTPLITTKNEKDITPLNFTDDIPAIQNVPEIDFEDFENEPKISVIPPDYTKYLNAPPNIIIDNNDFQKPNDEPEDFL